MTTLWLSCLNKYKGTTRQQSQSYASCALIRIDTINIIYLRLAEVFGDETDGLGTEVFGMEALATIGEGIGQRRTTSYPRIQAVQRHMRVAIRKIHHSKFGFTVGFRHIFMILLVVKL